MRVGLSYGLVEFFEVVREQRLTEAQTNKMLYKISKISSSLEKSREQKHYSKGDLEELAYDVKNPIDPNKQQPYRHYTEIIF